MIWMQCLFKTLLAVETYQKNLKQERLMLLTCPKCETIFRVDRLRLHPAGQPVHCRICDHMWTVRLGANDDRHETLDLDDYWHKACLLVIGLLTGAVILVGIIQARAIITSYLPSLIGVFQWAGLAIRPPLDQLLVVDLAGSYVGDMLRLRGALRNDGLWRCHAAPLLVKVTSPAGAILQATLIWPDDRIIGAKQQSRFFAQLDIDVGLKADVSVLPISQPVLE
jgi:predicted Zn finger-like uncharacterized protein